MTRIEKVGSFAVGRSGEAETLLVRPDGAVALLVLGHGAGAGMHHPFLASFAARLAEDRVATFRYQFLYMQKGSKRPDPPALLLATVRAAWEAAGEAAADLPRLAGGKSMGGRITSMAAAGGSLDAVQGLVFVGYPLQAAGRPLSSQDRSRHLPDVPAPMLFLQGTRDALAPIDSIRELCDSLGPRVRLHVVDDADHSFHVPKRTGRTDPEVLAELATVTAGWIVERLTPGQGPPAGRPGGRGRAG